MALSLSSVTTPVCNAFNSVVGVISGGALKAKSVVVSNVYAKFALSLTLAAASGYVLRKAYDSAVLARAGFDNAKKIESIFNQNVAKAIGFTLVAFAGFAVAFKVALIA